MTRISFFPLALEALFHLPVGPTSLTLTSARYPAPQDTPLRARSSLGTLEPFLQNALCLTQSVSLTPSHSLCHTPVYSTLSFSLSQGGHLILKQKGSWSQIHEGMGGLSVSHGIGNLRAKIYA